MKRLPLSFYARGAQIVGPALLGKRLVRLWQGGRLSGVIVETEAYCDGEEPDLACHGHRANQGRPTPRTEVMFGPAGFAYVYFNYGMHWLFNVVTGEPGQANAVLIRALQPAEGIEAMTAHRSGRTVTELSNGPAKLTQALAIAKSEDGANLCTPQGVIWIEDAPLLPDTAVATGPRLRIGKTPEPWLSMPWRYWIKDNAFVSK